VLGAQRWGFPRRKPMRCLIEPKRSAEHDGVGAAAAERKDLVSACPCGNTGTSRSLTCAAVVVFRWVGSGISRCPLPEPMMWNLLS
jgi:hypothetical protein